MIDNLFHNRIQFEVNPLDLGIARIEFQFIQNFTGNITGFSGKDRFTYTFQSKDPTLKLSTIELNCFQVKNNKQDELWVVKIVCCDRNGKQKNKTIFEGTEAELTQFLKPKQIFIPTKKLAKSLK